MTRESLQALLEATVDVSMDDDVSADDRDEFSGKDAVATLAVPQPSKAERQKTLTGREPEEPAKKSRKTSASKVAPTATARAPGGKQPGTKQPGTKPSEMKQDYTVYEILAGDCPLPKVHVYHAQMRLPKRLEGADVATKKEIAASMAAMVSAVALAPPALLTLGDDELQAHVAAVKAVLPTKSWPPTVFEHLIQRRCSAHLHQPAAFFDTVWPWMPEGQADSEFDALAPRMSTIARLYPGVAIDLAAVLHNRIIRDFMTTHMDAASGDQSKASATIGAMARFLQGAVLPDHAPAGVTEVRRQVMAIYAVIQPDLMSAEQISCLLSLPAGGDSQVGKLMAADWWAQMRSQAWKRAPNEGPASEYMQKALRDFKLEPRSDDAWQAIRYGIDKWKNDVRPTGFDSILAAIAAECVEHAAKMLGSTVWSVGDNGFAVVLQERMRWLQDWLRSPGHLQVLLRHAH